MNPTGKNAVHSIRMLARKLKISPTTVSEALRGVSRVAPDTAERVRTAALRYGYRRNPIAGAVMSEIRKSHVAHFRGTLGLLEIVEPQLPAGARRFYELLFTGARDRSAELGFTLNRFLIGSGHLRPERLNTLLEARGIRGLLVLPTFKEAHLEAVAWDRFAGVYLDRVIRFPPMHSVSTDHHSVLWAALEKLESAGYRRPGFIMQSQQGERLQKRWEGAFSSYGLRRTAMVLQPMLVAPEINETTFRRWFRRYRPDVVLGHSMNYIEWMKSLGARIPETHGFLCLNATMCDRPCAAINQQPALIGAQGADLVIGQILRGEFGLPRNPSHTLVPASLELGPTLRHASPVP